MSSVSKIIFMVKKVYIKSALPIINLSGSCYPNVLGIIFEWTNALISEPQWKGNYQVLQTCRAWKPSLSGICVK